VAKEFEPEDPMELVGMALAGGNPDEVLDGLVQEYLLMGWKPVQILWLFHSPHYAATHRLYRLKGEAYVRERVQHLARLWQEGWVRGGHQNAAGL